MANEQNPFVTQAKKQAQYRGCSYPNEVLAAMLFVAAEGSAVTALTKAWGKRAFTDPQRQLITLGIMLFVGVAVGLFYAYSKRQAAVERRLELSKPVTSQELAAIGDKPIPLITLIRPSQ